MSADPLRRILRPLLTGLLLTVPAAAAQAGEPALVRDLRPGSAQGQGAIDSRFITARSASGILFFGASDPIHGMELWRTDGTPQGTFRLTDVCPGRCSSLPDALEIFVFDGEVYFGADDGVSGRELWASGDTPGTSRRVRDLCPGPCNGVPSQLAEVGGRLYFEALLPGGARGLWISDGSRRGTTLLRELCHQFYEDTNCTYGGIVEAGGLALFQMNDTRLGVWRSDGTPEGTGPFTDVVGDFPSFANFVPTGGGAAFAWSDDALWFTDGTAAGTRRLKTAAQLGVDSLPFYTPRSTIWKGKLIAVLQGDALMRSDGTPEGTVRFGEISSGVAAWESLDDKVVLVSHDGAVWRTEGTPETTTGTAAGLPNRPYVTDSDVLGNRLAMCVERSNDPVVMELWLSDGTAAGTQRVEEGPGCSSMASVTADRLAFRGDLRRLQGTDGTPAGTSELRDFGTAPAGSGPLEQLAWKGQLLFSAQTSEAGAPLFLSDGTPPGTHEVDPDLDVATRLVQAGDQVFFEAGELADGSVWPSWLGLWKTDGSAAGTVEVDSRLLVYSSPVPVGNALFFAAPRAWGYNFEPDTELFRSDGTRPGTGLVKNINRFTSEGNLHHNCYEAPSDPGPGIELGGRLLFAADDGLRGRELWESTGTRAGTSMLRDIDPRRLDESPPDACDTRRSRTGLGSDPRSFIRFGDGVLFTATDGAAGRELWWTDGTAAGTRRVADIRPGGQGSEPHDLVLFRGRIWFVASSEGKGEELWRTDGTRRGTVRVRRLDVAALPARAWSLTAVGDRLFFVLSTEAAGPELWVSGGTAASTHRVLDVRPGPEGSYPQSLTAAHGLLVFAAADGTHGLEAWRSDGTAAGTFLLGDINPGLDASAPGPFTPITGGLVLSGADDGEHGRELWAFPVQEVP
jgi:large repetitive protein